MFDHSHDDYDAGPVLRLVPARPGVPLGFNRWGDVAPPAGTRIKALLLKGREAKVARGTERAIRLAHPGWTLHAWQRVPPDRVLPPHWRSFPESEPIDGTLCCVMYFDLHGEEPDCSGLAQFRQDWPIGEFEPRASGNGLLQPCDGARWAVYAWRYDDSAGQRRDVDEWNWMPAIHPMHEARMAFA